MGTVLALSIALFGCVITIVVANSSENPPPKEINSILVLGCVCFAIAIIVFATKDIIKEYFNLASNDSRKEVGVEETVDAGKDNTNDMRRPISQSELKDSDLVQWTDDVFENMVRKELGKPSGSVYVKDLDYITSLAVYGDKILIINYLDYDTINGFRYVDNSGKLLSYFNYSDSVGNEVSVKTVGEIRDISSLFYFRNLKDIIVIANRITDISVFNSMNLLECADVWGNQITDLSPLESIERQSKVNKEQNISIGDVLGLDN